MAWSEIKKVINTNFGKALDVLINEKFSNTDANIANVQTGINTLVPFAGAPVKTVKSVQRGTYWMSTVGGNHKINISPVDFNRAIIIDGASNYIKDGNSNWCHLEILSSTQIEAVVDMGAATVGIRFSWQIVEFY